jgi:hypothetical protein
MERKAIIIGDSQLWAPKASKHGVSIAQEINERLAELGLEVTVVQANKDRLNGWQRMKSCLKPVRKAAREQRRASDRRPVAAVSRVRNEDAGRGCRISFRRSTRRCTTR